METLSIPIQELLNKAPSHTINELSEMYQTDLGTIYRILLRYKVETADSNKPLTKEILEEVFQEPTTVAEAAEQLHTSPKAITSAIKKFGLFGGKRKPTSKSTFTGGRAFKVLGYIINHPEENLASVGRRFNCTREYVRQIKEVATAEGIIKSWANASDEFHKEAQQEGIEL